MLTRAGRSGTHARGGLGAARSLEGFPRHHVSRDSWHVISQHRCYMRNAATRDTLAVGAVC